MKWAYYVKDKWKAIAVLLLIIVLILANNISNRRTFSNLNQSIASIYKDRLMPATYIFQITDHLYQKRLLKDKNNVAALKEKQQHNKAIADIIKTYETTYLTEAEKQQWTEFKQQLQQYNLLSTENVAQNETANESFNKVIKTLNALSQIQASEGNNIFKISSLDINGTIIMSQLEVALLLILGILALVLISVSNNRLLQIQNPRLN